MPHLDANALVTDVEGLAFLQDVVGTSAVAPGLHAFDGARSTMRRTRARPADVEQERPRRRKGAVPEAA